MLPQGIRFFLKLGLRDFSRRLPCLGVWPSQIFPGKKILLYPPTQSQRSFCGPWMCCCKPSLHPPPSLLPKKNRPPNTLTVAQPQTHSLEVVGITGASHERCELGSDSKGWVMGKLNDIAMMCWPVGPWRCGKQANVESNYLEWVGGNNGRKFIMVVVIIIVITTAPSRCGLLIITIHYA